MAQKKSVDFFYDLSCPYAYLAHTQIEALCERADSALVWKPFLLGGLFRLLGSSIDPNVGMPAAKARMTLRDMQRWAEHFGVPLVRPPEHPCRTVLALRSILVSGDIARATKALYRAYWVKGLDVGRAPVVRESLDEAGFDGEALLLRAESPGIKAELHARTSEAKEAGVFGAPAFVVSGPGGHRALFWGQDRLPFVEKALSGWDVAPLVIPSKHQGSSEVSR